MTLPGSKSRSTFWGSVFGQSPRENRPFVARSYLAVEGTAWRMIRTARYKYVVYEEGQRREQLIDLEKDPGEMKNLASDPQYRGILMEHRRLLWEWTGKINDSIGQAYLVPAD